MGRNVFIVNRVLGQQLHGQPVTVGHLLVSSFEINKSGIALNLITLLKLSDCVT